jgi:hypothetical protein
MSALTAIWGEAMLDGIGCPVTLTRNASAKPSVNRRFTNIAMREDMGH